MTVERRWFGFFKRIGEGDEYPRGYGLAWRCPYSGTAWCCPVPLNWLVSYLRSGWYRTKRGRQLKADAQRWAKNFHENAQMDTYRENRELHNQLEKLRRRYQLVLMETVAAQAHANSMIAADCDEEEIEYRRGDAPLPRGVVSTECGDPVANPE